MDRIPRALVAAVVDEAESAVRERRVATLGTHMRLLYEIVVEAGEIPGTRLHERYEQRASDPKTKRQRRRYLERLERYGLIESQGATRGKRYGTVKQLS